MPACGKCNQSKSGRHWRQWLTGPALRTPRTRGVEDLDERIRRIEVFERTFHRRQIDLDKLVPKELWDTHWRNHDHLPAVMRESQETADKIRELATSAIE